MQLSDTTVEKLKELGFTFTATCLNGYFNGCSSWAADRETGEEIFRGPWEEMLTWIQAIHRSLPERWIEGEVFDGTKFVTMQIRVSDIDNIFVCPKTP